jgi:hypothetical protein
MHALQAALQAWLRCKPRGVCLPAEQARGVFPALRELLREDGVAEDALSLLPLFEPQVEGALLKQGSNDAVTFLSFWRVVAVVWHACGGDHGTTLTDELETFRDEILRCLEDPAQNGEMSSAQFHELARNAAELSSTDQDTWYDFADHLADFGNLTATDIAVVLMPFLQDAADKATAAMKKAGTEPVEETLSPNVVFLHIYDVSQDEKIANLNRWLAPQGSPLKFGGVFHAGVEVYGLEWAYGYTNCDTHPGIHSTLPKSHSSHSYRQSVLLGPTTLSAEEVAELISDMAEEWLGTEYDLLHRNCCTFADTLAKCLLVRRIPRWVHRLARVGATVDTAWAKVQDWWPGRNDSKEWPEKEPDQRALALPVAATGR